MSFVSSALGTTAIDFLWRGNGCRLASVLRLECLTYVPHIQSIGVLVHDTAAPLPACMIHTGASRLANIPIHNETDYTLTNEMAAQISRDAQEHFGEEISAIRVQSGLERHA